MINKFNYFIETIIKTIDNLQFHCYKRLPWNKHFVWWMDISSKLIVKKMGNIFFFFFLMKAIPISESKNWLSTRQQKFEFRNEFLFLKWSNIKSYTLHAILCNEKMWKITKSNQICIMQIWSQSRKWKKKKTKRKTEWNERWNAITPYNWLLTKMYRSSSGIIFLIMPRSAFERSAIGIYWHCKISTKFCSFHFNANCVIVITRFEYVCFFLHFLCRQSIEIVKIL